MFCEKAPMAMSLKVFWFIVHLAFLAIVNGNVITQTPLNRPEGMTCLEECQILDNGTLVIINITNPKQAVEGVAYATLPVRMKDPTTRSLASFNTSFTFREEPKSYNASDLNGSSWSRWSRGDGFVFALVNSSTWVGGPGGRLGMFKDLGNPKIVAVEFDNWKNDDTDTEPDEHVGVNIASPMSLPNCSAPVAPLGLSLWKRDILHSWIEYDGVTNILQVRLANTSSRPLKPIVTCSYDLYDAVDEKMWFGFSGAHGDAWSVYYIYNWTFTSFGISSEFSSAGESRLKIGLIVGICGGILLLFSLLGGFLFLRRRRAKDDIWDIEEMIEMAGMPEFISYKHLSAATKQFSDQSKLGEGGFGSVYRGVLPKTGAEVAVKKVSNNSRQGEKEFLAEVRIISQLRHRNVVELNGFCRDKGKFLLVYELLPRGSVDQALFKPRTAEEVLSWGQRWKIVSGTAAALHYLHEGWRQQVIHRDVKSSNIMLDEEYNPKLGDFGLARLVDHEKHAATTMVAGTYGFIAPEATGGRFTDKSDVFAFGAVALELACGRKAFAASAEDDDIFLVDMVWRRLNQGDLFSVVDPRLKGSFDCKEMEVLLLLGLLCSHPNPLARPCMRSVLQVLAGESPLPPVPSSKPELAFPSDSVSIFKRKLSSSRSRSNSVTQRLENSENSGTRFLGSQHSSVTGVSGMSSFPSDSSDNPDSYLEVVSKAK